MLNIPTRLEEVLVVKIGGGDGLDLDRCLDDIAAQQRPLIVVHGVSAAMNAMCEARGIPVRTLTSPEGHESRYTDAQTRDVFVEAADQVNREVVEGLRACGLNAIGLTGDNVIVQGQRKTAIRALVNGRRVVVRDDYTGTITDIDSAPILETLVVGQVVVVPPYAISADGLLNIDGDRAAAAIAAELGAAELVILSNVAGLYRDFSDANSLVPHITTDEIDQAMQWAAGRMKRKVLSASEALEHGVQRIIIADGRTNQPLTAALNGSGTEFVQ